VGRDWQRALAYDESAIALNFSSSLYRAGTVLLRGGPYRAPDESKAMEYLSKAVELKVAGATTLVGLLHLFGLGVEKNVEKAMSLFHSVSDADPNCWLLFGMLYEAGIGVDRDLERALSCYRTASSSNSLHSLTNLGNFYLLGQGVEKDEFQAVEIYTKANNGSSLFNLGLMHEFGVSVDELGHLSVSFMKRSVQTGFRPSVQFLSQRYASSLSELTLVDSSASFFSCSD
jgi:TPR repeat protein